MENIRACIAELREGIREGVRDHSVVAKLRTILSELTLSEQLIGPYCDLLFKLYDLSNNPNLLSQAPIPKAANPTLTLDPLAISLKSLTLTMLAALVSFFNESSLVNLPPSMISQALQIMIMVSRVLLDIEGPKQVRGVYGLVVTFREGVGLRLSVEVEMAHWLNLVELMAGDIDTRDMQVGQYKNAVDQLTMLMQEPGAPRCYEGLLQHITFEVVLKLLKKCRSKEAQLLIPYLTDKMQNMLNSLMTLNLPVTSETNQSIKLSPFYQLYLQISQNGYNNIQQSSLRIFLSQQTNFNDQRVFDVVALTGQGQILQIWFEIQLKRRVASELKEKAYRCFVYLVDRTIDKIDQRDSTLEHGRQQDLKLLTQMLELSRVVMVSMLSQKKQSAAPLTILAKRLCKLLTYLVMHLHLHTDSIQEFTQKLLLLCNKHNLSELSRSIVTIHFYYQLLMGTVTQQSYGQLCRANLIDKGSELFRCMKLAYMFRTGKEMPQGEESGLLMRQPFIMVLFAKQPQQEVILRCPAREMAKIKQKWQVYILLLNGDQIDMSKLPKILTHMQQTLIADNWAQLSRQDVDNLEDLKAMLMSILVDEKENVSSEGKMQLCVVLFYLVNMTVVSSKLQVLGSAVLLNRYSKLIRLISLGQEETTKMEQTKNKNTKLQEMMLYLTKQYLTSCHQNLKIKHLQGQIANQPGFLVLLDVLHEFLSKSKMSTLGQLQFFKFVRFEILCLLDTYPESQLYQEQSPKMLKLFCSSLYIQKQLKLKIMRKLIREDLLTDSKLLSFGDVVGLIELAGDIEEKRVFASYLMRAFGEQGRKYVMMESERDPNIFGLVEDDDEF